VVVKVAVVWAVIRVMISHMPLKHLRHSNHSNTLRHNNSRLLLVLKRLQHLLHNQRRVWIALMMISRSKFYGVMLV
jgi:serine acetyltransferase